MVSRVLSLERTVERIRDGVTPVVALKECCDAWNACRAPEWYMGDPILLDQPNLRHINIWVAGAAEYAAFLIHELPPAWTERSCRFLDRPIISGHGANARRYALVETPFAFRRRLLFSGKTMLA